MLDEQLLPITEACHFTYQKDIEQDIENSDHADRYESTSLQNPLFFLGIAFDLRCDII
jgi:hypothetical protein